MRAEGVANPNGRLVGYAMYSPAAVLTAVGDGNVKRHGRAPAAPAIRGDEPCGATCSS